MLNRSQPPPIHPIRQLELPRVDHLQLSNGIPVAVVPLGTQDVLRLDVIFLAGRPWEEHRLAARATLALLREGTRQRDAAEIAEHFDFFGSSLRMPPHLDTANLVLYTPRRYAAEVFPLLAEMLTEPDFPEAELEAFKTRHQRRLEVDLQKVEVVGYRQLTELLYGRQHPYGYNSDADAYRRLQPDWLQAHYRNWYHGGLAEVKAVTQRRRCALFLPWVFYRLQRPNENHSSGKRGRDPCRPQGVGQKCSSQLPGR
jgi:predicted Zn-dependent peptidase